MHARLRLGERLRGRRRRVGASLERVELGAGVGGAGEQLVVRRAVEPPLRVRDPVEPGLELLEPSRLRLERGEKRVQVGGRLAQPQLDVAQLVADALELRREPLERRHGPLGESDETGRAVAVVGREGVRRGGGALRQLGDVAEPLALAAQPLLASRLHPLRVLDERLKLGEAHLRERGVRRQLLVTAPRGELLPPGGPHLRLAGRSCSSPQKRSSTSSWYAGRASRRCSNWPDIATTRSTAAATSSRAAARPQA